MATTITSAGTYTVVPGETYVIAPAMQGEVKFVAHSSDPAPVDFKIELNEDPSHTGDVKIKIDSDDDLSPELVVAGDYEGPKTEIDLKKAYDSDVQIGDGAIIEKFEVSEDGQDRTDVGAFDRAELIDLGQLELDGNGSNDDALTLDTSWMTADELAAFEQALIDKDFVSDGMGGWTNPHGDDVNVKFDLDGDGSDDFELKLHNWESINTNGGEDPDFIVEGTSGDDLIDTAYTGDPEGDSVDAGDNATMTDADVIDAGSGDDTIKAGQDDDTVYAGGGNDSVMGEAGNDIIYGDQSLGEADGNSVVRESLEWNAETNPAAGFTQTTGTVDVTFSQTSSAGVTNQLEASTQNVSGIDTGGETIDAQSSFESILNGAGNTGTYTLDFSEDVTDVSFRVNDIDGDGVVRILAYQNGVAVELEITAGSNLTTSDTDTVPGDDTADSNGGYMDDDSDEYSILVSIPGPVDQIVIEHSQDGGNNSGINITDVYFGAPVVVDGEGDDTLSGGVGDDLILGEGGNDSILGDGDDDTLDGGEGDDTLEGGSGNDSIVGGTGNDSIDGDTGDDTVIGGEGDDTVIGGADNDSIEGNGGSDSIVGGFGDDFITSGNVGLPDLPAPEFTIPGSPDTVVPEFLGDPDTEDDKDTIEAGGGNDTILSGDDDDSINAGGGNDIVDAGFDDDTVLGESGADLIVGGEGSDSLIGGGDNDTIYGGLGPGTDILDVADDGVGSPIGPDPVPDNGDDYIEGGSGNDVIFGQDDDDTILGGGNDDLIDGGLDNDSIQGGTGSDTITGGHGADTMQGGADADTFLVGQFGGQSEGIGDSIAGGENGVDDDTLDLSGAGPLQIIYDDSVDADGSGDPGEAGTVIFYADKAQTTVTGTLTFEEIENVIPCFTPGTLIATPKGEVPVESLSEGDKIITRDNGIQEIRWAGSRTLDRSELAKAPNLRPILIKAGSLGNGLPERDMLVSPQHRVLVSGERTQLYFDESEVLVAAKHLVNGGSIAKVNTLRTTYIHFMFDQHEVVLSDGAWTESFQPGDQTLGAMGDASRDEIFALFPELKTSEGVKDYTAARRALKAHEAKLLQL